MSMAYSLSRIRVARAQQCNRRAFGLQNKKLSYTEAMTASLFGGIMSAFVTLPIDVLVAQIQQASKAGQHVSVATLFNEQFKAGGWERVAGFATRVKNAMISPKSIKIGRASCRERVCAYV